MIASMTAFARKKEDTQWGAITIEIRTVNHRYCEMSIRSPDILRQFEKDLRDLLQQKIARGKIDVTIKYVPNENVPFNISINQHLTTQITDAANKIAAQFPTTQIQVMDVLSWPGVLQTEETHLEDLGKALLKVVDDAIAQLHTARLSEGEGLKQFIDTRLNLLLAQIAEISSILPEIETAQRERISNKFAEFKENLNPDRVEQEMIIFLHRMDVAEELHRLQSHIKEVKDHLKKGGAIGRKLDFYMQELNREANTLASKSVNALMSQAAIEMKVAIEQMREQVQNIE